jgi:membrane protein
LSFGKAFPLLKKAGQRFLADDCMGLAQQIAYSTLLAFFPAVAFLLGLLGLLHLYDPVQTFLASVAPHGVITFVESLQQDSSGGTSVLAFVLGLGGALWAASGAAGVIIKAVNRAYELEETRPFWKLRLTALVLVLLSAVTGMMTVLLVVFGGPLGSAIANRAHFGSAWDLSWAILRWPVTFAAVLLFFGLVYYLAPNLEMRKWSWITPGAVLGSVTWLLLSGLFALYATFSGSYSKTYGTLAAGVILLLWLNYTAWAILFGAELNSEVKEETD